MKIIRLKKCASTNDEIKRYFHSLPSSSPICLIAEHQYKGKGQLGANWNTEANQNLTFSFLFPDLNLPVGESFKINLLVTLKIHDVFQKLGFHKLKFKWPNDLILENKKIGGILIENILQARSICRCIVGIGINVNQTNFEVHPQASSLKKIFHRDFDSEEIYQMIIAHFEDFENQLYATNLNYLLQRYHSNLFRLQKASMFELDGEIIPGIIHKVKENGRLQIEFEDQNIQEFDVKEIKLIY